MAPDSGQTARPVAQSFKWPLTPFAQARWLHEGGRADNCLNTVPILPVVQGKASALRVGGVNHRGRRVQGGLPAQGGCLPFLGESV